MAGYDPVKEHICHARVRLCLYDSPFLYQLQQWLPDGRAAQDFAPITHVAEYIYILYYICDHVINVPGPVYNQCTQFCGLCTCVLTVQCSNMATDVGTWPGHSHKLMTMHYMLLTDNTQSTRHGCWQTTISITSAVAASESVLPVSKFANYTAWK